MDTPLVVVAMSGGVDSSVAAALLVEQGFRVAGMMLRLWSEEGREDENRCCTPDAMAQARRVAAMLDIPFYAVDVRERFRGSVVREFLEGYQNGLTPNPCIVCNRHIRWGYLLEQAQAVGAEFMATGHYARLVRVGEGPVELWRARDEHKDQSYVLSSLNQAQLARTLLPLGELAKPEVRELARKFQLPVAERPDSQDLCFLGNEDYRSFLARHVPETVRPGEIVNREGTVLGAHQGLAFYTIGQHKGLGIAAPEPYYVVEKVQSTNRLVVGLAAELGKQSMLVREVNWISGDVGAETFDAQVKIRYKAVPAGAMITRLEARRLSVEFAQPVRDITPGQLAVFYDGDRVLASGMIEQAKQIRP
jgi:tRNA-uridine 2-sulfurtransferase